MEKSKWDWGSLTCGREKSLKCPKSEHVELNAEVIRKQVLYRFKLFQGEVGSGLVFDLTLEGKNLSKVPQQLKLGFYLETPP